MPNRYTQPGQAQVTNNYTSQYVPYAFDQLEKVLQAKQQTYNVWNDGIVGQDTQLMGTQALPGVDSDYVAGIQKQYHGALNELSSTDLTRPENQQRAKQIVQELASNEGFQRAQMSQRNAAQAQAQWKELDKEGKSWLPQAQLLAHKLSQYNAGGGAGGGQVFEAFDFTPVADHVAEADKIMSVMKPNEVETLRGLAAEGGDIAYKLQQSGISGDQVRRTVAGAGQQWLTSRAGIQMAQMGEAEALRKGASEQEAAQYGQQVSIKYLFDRGMSGTYSKFSTGQDVAFNTRRKEGLAKKAKEEEDAGFTMMNGFSLPGQKEREPEFDSKGNFRAKEGTWEAIKAGYLQSSNQGQGTVQSLTHAISKGLAYSGIFGKQTSEAMEKFLQLPENELTDHYNLEKQYREKAITAGKPMPPMPSPKEWYAQSHGANLMQNYDVPVLTSKKAQTAAYGQVVDSGWINNARLIDPTTRKEYTGKDLIKFEDGKAKNEIQVVSSPNSKWSTQFDPSSILVNVDGKAYIAAGSGLKGRAPRSIEEALQINRSNMDWVKDTKYGKFTWYHITYDKGGQPVDATPMQVESHYNPSIMDQPELIPIGK